MTNQIKALEVRRITPTESILFPFDFTHQLATSETVSSATIAVSPSGPTLGSAAANTTEVERVEDRTVIAIGKGVQARVSSCTADTDYTLTVTATTSLSNTRVLVCTLECRSS